MGLSGAKDVVILGIVDADASFFSSKICGLRGWRRRRRAGRCRWRARIRSRRFARVFGEAFALFAGVVEGFTFEEAVLKDCERLLPL
jgi:anti-sigma factor RsiW